MASKHPRQALAEQPSVEPPATPAPEPAPLLRMWIGCLALAGAFALPLFNWVRFALKSELYSYTLLIPVVSAYLLITLRSKLAPFRFRALRPTSLLLLGLGLLATVGVVVVASAKVQLPVQDSVALNLLPFVLLVAAYISLGLDSADLRRVAFPLAFLGFMLPFPTAVEHAIETFLQHGSAPPAYWMYQLVGTPIFRQDLVFQLPNITLHVAPECSGIRSTVVLFITSILAGHLFLRSPTKRALLTLFVIPLALLRNGFRIFTIGQLCVHVGPHMIDSIIHHRGGPIFFALSLIPFSALLFILVKSDRAGAASTRSHS